MRLELRHLEVVVAIGRAGSIRRAAALLQITQPALTAQLQRIEQAIGGQLFTRTGGGVVPTELGRYVIARTAGLTAAFEDLCATARTLAERRRPVTPLQVGGVIGVVVPSLMSALRELFPGREVTSRQERSVATLVELVAGGGLDVAVLHEFPGFPVRLPSVVAQRTLLHEPVFVGLAAGHRLVRPGSVELAELAREDWAMPEPDDSGLHSSFRLACEAAGFTPRFRHQTNEAATAIALVTAGQAVCGIYPTRAPVPGMAIRPLAGNPHSRRLLLVWREASPIADHMDSVWRGVRTSYLDLVARCEHYAVWWREHGSTAAPD